MSFNWDGGENNYEGPHDDFCFVCGGTMELIGCQTCENCYHVDCMTPSPENIPSFWFCPHCTDRDWHIPPEPLARSSSPANPPLVARAPTASRTDTNSQSSSHASTTLNQSPRISAPNGSAPPKRKFATNIDRGISRPNERAERPTPAQLETKSTQSRPKRSYSPPRKRSKYSSFSSEVDKALVVIQRELEFAAGLGKSEDALQDKIRALEQELKLKDGQIMLSNRELDLARKHSSGSSRLKSENIALRDENEKLHALVERKDRELKDWRTKLRDMIGDDLNE